MASKLWIGTTTAWATSGNWSPANAPAATGDSAYFDYNGTAAVAGSDQSATLLDLLSIKQSYIRAFGDTTPLKVKATLVRIGEQSGSTTTAAGSGRINLDLSTAVSTVNIYGSASSSTDTYKEPIRIKAVNASNTMNLLAGRVGIATDAIGDVSTFGTINITGNGAYANLGSGLTLTTLNQSDGVCNVNNAITTVNYSGGSLQTEGVYTITNFNASSGGQATLNHRQTSGYSITTLTGYDGAFIDLSQNALPFTVFTFNVNGEVTIKRNPANPGHFTWVALNFATGSILNLI